MMPNGPTAQEPCLPSSIAKQIKKSRTSGWFKGSEVVLELSWFHEQQDLWFTPPSPHRCHRPANRQPSKDQSQPPGDMLPPHTDMPPHWCATAHPLCIAMVAAKHLGLWGKICLQTCLVLFLPSFTGCLPRPTRTVTADKVLVFGLLLVVVVLTLIDSYTLRLRRAICTFFYPKVKFLARSGRDT